MFMPYANNIGADQPAQLPGLYNTSSFYIQNFKLLASLCSPVGRFESYLFGNPKDRFSHDEVHAIFKKVTRPGWGSSSRPRIEVRLQIVHTANCCTYLIFMLKRSYLQVGVVESKKSMTENSPLNDPVLFN